MKKIVYYTCYFGGDVNYSKMIPKIPSEKEDCYYFTNNKDIYNKLENTKFIRIFLNIPIENCNVKNSMHSKEIKSCPHRFDLLKNYEYVCWFDSKIDINEQKMNEIINILDTSDKIRAMTKHVLSNKYTSVWDEYNLCIQYDRYRSEKDRYTKYIEAQLKNGFSEKIDVFFCSTFILRKNCAKTHEMDEMWYRHIQECGIECQISFGFIQQKYSDSILPLEYQETWKYCFD